MRAQRQIVFHKYYFTEFYVTQTKAIQEKIDYVFTILRTVEKVPRKFFDHMEGTDGLHEIRIEYNSIIYRVFCCFDKGNLVILFNGFQKKSQETPKQVLDLAIKLKKEYFSSKNEPK